MFSKKRKKLPMKKSKKMFSRSASNTQSINMRAVPMRGGFRI